MRAQIIDLETGEQICSKDFTQTTPAEPLKASFDLLGQQRDLVTCGGGEACSRIDQKTGDRHDLAGIGPLNDFTTSVVTSDNKWYLASPDGKNRHFFVGDVGHLTTTAQLDSLSVDQLDNSDFLGGVDLNSREDGHLLYSFSRPGDTSAEPEPVLFYGYNHDGAQSHFAFFFKYKGAASKSVAPPSPWTFDLGRHPVCGHAFRDDGRARFYCFVDFLDALNPGTFDVDTRGTEGDFAAQSADPNSNPDPLEEEVSAGGYNTFVGTGISSSFQEDAFGLDELRDGSRRAAVTHWLGDHRSAVIPNGGAKRIHMVNANGQHSTTEFLTELKDGVELGENVLYATAATQQDYINLGCT